MLNTRSCFLLSLLLLGFILPAQQESPDNFSRLAQITEREVLQELDSATQASYIPFHARYYPIEKPLNQGSLVFYNPELALKLYYGDIALAADDTITFIDLATGESHYLTQADNFRKDWSSEVYNEGVKLVYNKTSKLPIKIEGYSLQKKIDKILTGFGDADFCEINANCEEGKNFRDVQKSVVKISLKISNYIGYCSGALINNTLSDHHPYLISAEHCAMAFGDFASASDFNAWEFYFNYESSGCNNPASESEVNFTRIRGARLVARSDDNGGDFGSDFLLLELSNQAAFDQLNNPYFAGWNRSGQAPQSGVSFHHPVGDIKKVSTFKSAPFSSSIKNIVPDTHWELNWSSTPNGKGVTEGGSSGCPLLDEAGHINGMLTGGLASCSQPGNSDLFGKFSYSWSANGTDEFNQLAPWLDPLGEAPEIMPGIYKNDPIPNGLKDTLNFEVTTITSDSYINIQGFGQITDEVQADFFLLNGKLVKSVPLRVIPNQKRQIPVEGLQAGFYLLRISNGAKVQTSKVVILNQ